MNSEPVTSARRLKSALLAGAVAFGIGGYAVSGALTSGSGKAFAEEVRVEAPAPADFSTIVEKVKPAVVSVRVKSDVRPAAFNGRGFEDLPEDHPFNEFFRRFGDPRGQGDDGFERGPRFGMPGQDVPNMRPRMEQSQGSGFFISEDGYIVTNHHVVDGAKEVAVLMDDGRELPAKVIGSDQRTDLALLKVERADEPFTYVSLAKEMPKIGQWVVAVGNPFGLGGTVTAGIVSAENRNIGAGPYDDFIQIDAPVNRGNSGGPTFNTKGEVIGVNAAIFSPSGGNVGIAFAIPSTTVAEVVSDLQRDGSVTRGWLGVQIQPVTEDVANSLGLTEEKGALVSDPQPNGPAVKAGIKAGDVILAVNDEEVKGPRELARMIAAIEPEQTISITLWRDGKQQDLDVKLAKLSDSQTANASSEDTSVEPTTLEDFGLALAPSENGEGVVVTGVEADSVAGERGFEQGDIITTVGGTSVDSVKSVETAVAQAKDKGRKAVLMQVKSAGERAGTRFIALPLKTA